MTSRSRDTAWYLAIGIYVAILGAWMLAGLIVALTAHAASWHAWALAASDGKHGSAWTSIGRGLITGAAHSYPTTYVVLDYIYSAANLLIAAALLRLAPRDRSARLMVVGLAGTAGAFNLQAHTVVQAVAVATGVQINGWQIALLHGVGGTAYAMALLVLPTGNLPWSAKSSAATRALVTSLILALCALIATGTARYPLTFAFAIFFGLLIPLGAGVARRGRFGRIASPEVREQSRILVWALWITFAAAAALTAIAASTQALGTPGLPRDVPGISIGMPGLTDSLPGLGALGTQAVAFEIFRFITVVIPGAVLVATIRFRLGSVELLFNRALIYGGLVAVTGGTYVFVVVRVDAWFGLDSDWLAPPQVAAAGLVALAFHPLRIRFERLADRLVYGRRVAPYEVLARVSALSRTSASADALADLARIAAEGLRAKAATVYLDLEDGTRAAYSWPANAAATKTDRNAATDANADADADADEINIMYHGSHVGALLIAGAPGRESAADRSALLDQFISAAGVVVHTAGLAIKLEHKLRAAERHAEEIRASRWRIVAAQDGERRELERNLHDGAQPALTAVRFSLGLAAHLTASGGDQAHDALTRLRDQIDDASVVLRQTLRGLAPAALGDHGIGRALRELAESLGTDTRFQLDDATSAVRFTAEIEAAVYFCCAEAVQNAAKHCPGASVTAALSLARATRTGELSFTVADNGPGFDAAASTGSGMQNMADRIAAVGGMLDIESTLGQGTTVRGKVPTAPLPDQTEAGVNEAEPAVNQAEPAAAISRGSP